MTATYGLVRPGGAPVTERESLSVVIDALERAGRTVKLHGDQVDAQCPAHDDQAPSLSIRYDRPAGKVLLNCHVGCAVEDVVAAIGLTMSDLFDVKAPEDRARKPEIVATYDYTDETGQVLFQKVRMSPKDFRVRRPDGRGGFEWKIGDARRVLYRLPELRAAIAAGRPVLSCEGEKDCERAAAQLGMAATCNFEGAAKDGQRPKWRPAYSEMLRGAKVLIVADNDEAGFAHAHAVAEALNGVAAQVRVVRPAVEFRGADLTDHLDAGHGVEDLIPILDGGDGDLPEPTPLQTPRVPVSFPTDALPEWVAAWVRAEAVATQTPEDLAGVCALCVLAACAGGRAEVLARAGWSEPTNLYGLPVMPPGSRKSAVIAAATRPLYGAEQELTDAVKVEQAEAVLLREIAQKAAKMAMDKAASGKGNRDDLTAEAITAASQAEGITVPVTPRLIADDVTPEAVGSLLAEHGGRLAIISAEGGVFEVMNGRYSGGVPSLDVWLKGHAGDPLRVDRKGRPSEYVPKPALTLLLTVQPSVLAGIARNGTFRGRGLTARFLYSLPPDNVGRRLIGAATMPEDVADTYDKRVRQLVGEMHGWTDPAVLQLAPDAHELLLDLERAVEPRLARDGEYGSVREWASKLVGAILRIAGLLHLAEDGERFRVPISRATLYRASLIGSYFVEHATAAFDLLGDGGTTDAAYLLEFLRRRQLDRFTIRGLLTDLPRGRFANVDEVTATVGVLVEHGWVIPEPPTERTGPGRRPSPGFTVHPKLSAISAQSAESQAARTRPAPPLLSAESAQSAERPAGGDSADNADIADTSTDQKSA